MPLTVKRIYTASLRHSQMRGDVLRRKILVQRGNSAAFLRSDGH
jgi:hypothetical protein